MEMSRFLGFDPSELLSLVFMVTEKLSAGWYNAPLRGAH